MYDILSTSIDTCPYVCQSCGIIPSHDEAVTDPWLFTHPAARIAYTFQERVHLLREDIRTYVMHNGRWTAEELEYYDEVQRLLRENLLVAKGTFGYLSPHPTVYRSAHNCWLEVARRKLYIRAGEDVVFTSWLERLVHPGYSGPVRVGRLHYIAEPRLCCQKFPGFGRLCDSDLEIRYQMLGTPSSD